MNRRTSSAAFVVLMVLVLVMPAVAAARPAPGFRATHLAEIAGSTLSAPPQMVRQDVSIIHADPTWRSFSFTIAEGFFSECLACPPAADYDGYLSIFDYDRDGVWTMFLFVYAGADSYRIEADGLLAQARRGKPFTFTPTADPRVYLQGYNEIRIGYGDPTFTVIGTPID